jgi:hypothetical protein
MGMVHLALFLLAKFKIQTHRDAVLLQKMGVSAIRAIAVLGIGTGL